MVKKKLNPDDIKIKSCSDGVGLFHNGDFLRTPGDHKWIVPTIELANDILDEFRDHEVLDGRTPKDVIEKMPSTRLALMSLDWVHDHKQETIQSMLGFVDTDLLCYRASAPKSLCQKQHDEWDPLLSWAKIKHGFEFEKTESLSPLNQSEDLLKKVQEKLDSCDDFTIAGLRTLVEKTKSIVITFALMEDVVSAKQGVRAAELEEIYQREYWGKTEEDLIYFKQKEEEIDQIVHYLHAVRESHGNSSQNPK